MEISIDKKIEAILFFKGDAVKHKFLLNFLNCSKEELQSSIEILKERLENSGLTIIEKDDSILLATKNELSEIIERLRKEELDKSLSKAALETLTIIIYRGPVKRSEIDYIRGVSSQFILRTLLVRGLIEKIQDPKDDRAILYRPTFETIQFLGINKKEDMPDYDKVNKDIQEFIENSNEDQ